MLSDKNNVENCEKVKKREKPELKTVAKTRMSHKRNFRKIKD